MNSADRLVAATQIWLASLYALGFLGVLFLLLLAPIKMDPESHTILLTMLGVLGTLATQQSGYFFARQRPASQDNPAAPVTNLTATVQGVRQ